MQKCDGVMASGHNVLTFAIPALQPLVLNLFVRPARESQDLDIQRYVIFSIHHCFIHAVTSVLSSHSTANVYSVCSCSEWSYFSCYREVVVSMLLRLVEYSRVVVLLTHVLDCYKRKKQKWKEVMYSR